MTDEQFQLLQHTLGHIFREMRYTNILISALLDEEQIDAANAQMRAYDDRVSLAHLEQQFQEEEPPVIVAEAESVSADEIAKAMKLGGYEIFKDLIDAAVSAGYKEGNRIYLQAFIEQHVNNSKEG